jgi:hypothetical protein
LIVSLPLLKSQSRGYLLKYCPSCNFTFADFHHVCDFDGTELVSDPERALAEVAPRPSLVRRCLKSPGFLAAAGLIAVVSSAVLIGYFDILQQTRPARTDAPPNALEVAAAVTTDLPTQQASVKRVVTSTHQIRRAKHSTTASTHFVQSRREVERPQLARSPSPNRPNYQPQPSPRQSAKAQGSEVALPTKSQPPAREKAKESLVTAMLKSTWRVLKKPFKF